MLEEPANQNPKSLTDFNAIKMWQKAFHLIKKNSFDLNDPWSDFSLDIATKTAKRHRFSAIKKKWIIDTIEIKIESCAFDRGAMRSCFKMKKRPSNGQWSNASNYVAKHYIDKVDRNVYFEDVKLQMEAKLWGEAYNRLNPPKKVDIFQLSVMELEDEETKETEFYHIERYMEGDYRKYNSNSGFVDEKIRNTPQAFSHFTFERSGHRLMVVDIQGVGDLYTDPQIHTSDGIGYSDGNLGLRGMALFFHSHRCNPICEWLGLAPFDLSELEVLQKHPTLIKMNLENSKNSDNDDESAIVHEYEIKNTSMEDSKFSFDNIDNNCINRRKSFDSSNDSSFIEGVSTPRIVSRRRRTVSYNANIAKPDKIFDIIETSNNGSIESFQRIFGSTVKRNSEESLLSFQSTTRRKNDSTSSYSADPSSPFVFGEHPRNRAHSGDSGISGHGANNNVKFVENQSNSSTCTPNSNGNVPKNDVQVSFAVSTNFPRVFRRNRTISESSDVDAEEFTTFTANNFPHQMLSHENQKPSCADHPTNLDQEIGQSILGQIHHELARLHESGRFSKLKENGGWSCGIALANKDSDLSDLSIEEVAKIDWISVIFHEKNAAQLGCLEAMIVMAHYYLGLPTTLLYDCPIKAGLKEVGMGMDYLWKAAEGGDRRCMILLARYLDTYAAEQSEADVKEFEKFLTTPKDLIVLPRLAEALSLDDSVALGLSSQPAQKPWAEAVLWYKKAIDTAAQECPIDEGFDAEGRYDAASDLLTVYRLLARMAEMYLIGGHGIKQDFEKSAELFNEAAERAMSCQEGQLAMKFFELSEEAYALIPETT